MESLKLVELTTAAFELKRSLLQLKLAQTECTITYVQLHQAKQKAQLSITQHQHAQITLALITARSRSSILNTADNANEINH